MKKFTFLLVALLAFTVQSYGQFPNPYCSPTPFTYVEPITLVNFAGINNPSPAATTGIPHEDFTTIVANVDTDASYPITIKGNTGGNWTNYIRAYFDWNQDNDFLDAGESYDLGTIVNSTGLDAIQLNGTITVPASALAGSTRMRVVKAYAGYADSCNTSSALFGQVEDYSVMVVIPTCVAPSNGMANVTSSTTADLTWTSAVTEGEIVVQEAGTGTPATAPGTGETFTGATAYEATGLLAMTAYEFYVRNECTPDVFSSWAGPFAFNTTQLPGCASDPTPADGATNVPVGDVTFSWTAPTTGDPAVSFDMYYGLTPGEANIFVANFPTTTAEITLTGYNTDFYWMIVPVNVSGDAIGCIEWHFTTEPAPGYCLDAPNGQYPSAAAGYTPATCDGIFENVVTTAGWTGEYSLINVTAGQTYTFSSSIATDFITISDAAGTTSYAAAVSPLTWESTLTGQIRFYTHNDDQCNYENVSRSRIIVCGLPATDAPDFANLQWPETLTISQGESGTVFGQVYEAGLTDVAPNIDGQAPGIQAWVGISPEGQNTDPSTWTNWTVATHNAAHIGNNDEYQATIGANLAPGTYYYATRFRLNTGGYVYGGFDGGFWNGTTEVSGVLIVNAPPIPANDDCSGALNLVVNSDLNCGTITAGTTFGATLSMDAAPCFGNPDDDVWYSFVATSASHVVSLTNVNAVFGTSTDMYFQVLSGACGSETSLLCSDADSSTVSGLTVGNTYYVRVYSYFATSNQTFNICIGTPPAPPANDECEGAITLEIDSNFCDGTNNNGTNVSATDSGIGLADCFNYGANDVWFVFTTPENMASVDVSTDFLGGTLVDTEIALYSGACGSLVEMACSQDDGTTVLSNGFSWNSLITDAAVNGGETYYVRVSGYSSANTGTFCLRVGTNTLSADNFDRTELAVYPNPVKDVLKFSYSENITEVAIFNLLGQKVMVKAMNAPDGQVDMSQLASGAYIVKVSAGNDTKSIKVIKE